MDGMGTGGGDMCYQVIIVISQAVDRWKGIFCFSPSSSFLAVGGKREEGKG